MHGTCLIKFLKEVKKMCSCKLLITLLAIEIICVFKPGSAQSLTDMYYKCSRNRNYTNGSSFESNLKSLMLNSMTSVNETSNGFYNVSEGLASDIVYSIALCRGDLQRSACVSCVNASTHMIIDLCLNQKEAVMWSNDCMLRYSDQSIYGVLDYRFGYMKWNERDASNVDLYTFNRTLSQLLSVLRDNVVNASLKFDVGEAKLAENSSVYALVQCTPDLSEVLCRRCLDVAISEIPRRIPGRRGGKSLGASCNIRFKSYKFYDVRSSVALLPPPPQVHPPSPAKGSGKGAVIALVLAVAVCVVVSITGFIFFKVRRSRAEYGEDVGTKDTLQLDFDAVSLATDNFNEANKLGEGAFGAVYKGKLLDGQEVAVKKLSKHSNQGDIEFKNEVVLLAKLQHKNLVKLIGFSFTATERLLVYELIPNASLDQFLLDDVKRSQLNWRIRYNIIEGIARGLLYLHQDSCLRIIHRDLKASNILLDADMNPKISDFGMARLFTPDETHRITNKVVGTYGYMAPEYAMQGQFSAKSDVYSFGVLVMELITGKMNNTFHNDETGEILFGYVWRKWKEGEAEGIIDPLLLNDQRNEMLRCLQIGLLCVQENALARPTMAAVLLMLSAHSTTLISPMRPAFLMHSAVQSEVLLSSSGTSSVNQVSNLMTEPGL